MRKSAAIVVMVLGVAGLASGGVSLLRHLLASEHSWADVQISSQMVQMVAGAVVALAGLVFYGRAAAAERDKPGTFLTSAEDGQVVQAIEAFEKRTSGELRVHLQNKVEGEDLMAVAKRTFDKLGLTATRERNGVLFFVAVKERRFAVLGDQGIDQKVPAGFWDNVVAAVGERFKQAKFGEGLVEGIKMAGEQLAAHFPPRADDVNELPNQISRGT
ncbi:MAG TPA: TPM domain-containing protein [Myxococcaceae bacterium]|nr:TPM domain-containing protein [Myxococcaceae bacterium]